MDIDSPLPKRRRSSADSDASSARRSSPPAEAEDSTRARQTAGRPSNGYPDERPHGTRDASVSSRSRSRRRSTSSQGEGRRWRSRNTNRSTHSRSRSRAYSEGSYSSRDRRREYSTSGSRSRSWNAKSDPIPSFTQLGEPLEGHLRGISCVKFSPNGRMIASASADGTVRLWSTPTDDTPSTLLATLHGHLAGISTLAFSPDSRMLATGSDDKIIRLWAVPSGIPYRIPLAGHHNYVYSLAFSPKGNMLVSGSFDEAVFLWDVRSGRIMRSLPAHSDPVSGVDFNRDGTLIVSCSTDGLIRVWDAMTGQCLRTLVHEDRRQVSAVRFAPNSQYVIAWTLDQRIRLWDYVAGKCVKTYSGHLNTVYSLSGTACAYEPGSQEAFLVSGSEDGSIWAWDITSKDALWTSGPDVHNGTVLSVDVMRKGNGELLMATAGLDRRIRLWKGKIEKGKRSPINTNRMRKESDAAEKRNGHIDGENAGEEEEEEESSDEEEEDEEEDDDEKPAENQPHNRGHQKHAMNGETKEQDEDRMLVDGEDDIMAQVEEAL